MKTKRIQFTVEIEDNIFIEASLIERLRFLIGGSIIDYKTIKTDNNGNTL